MTNPQSTDKEGKQLYEGTKEQLESAQAEQAGADFVWHFGRVTRLGNFEIGEGDGAKSVTILWDEGGLSSQQGDITGQQWEIFKLAFQTSGRIALLSDRPKEGWMYDYRFLEALR